MRKLSATILAVMLAFLAVFCMDSVMTVSAASESVTMPATMPVTEPGTVPGGVTEPSIPASTEQPKETSPSEPGMEIPQYLWYEIVDNEAVITGCDPETAGDLIIPAYIEGYPVTAISPGAFGGRTNLTTVTIPDSVTRIEGSIFEDCSSLVSVKIPDSATYIGAVAFAGCSSLASVTIPDGVTFIGDNAFGACISLTEVTIPGSVESIGEYAFGSCDSLTSVTIEDGVTYIGPSAFQNCSNLTEITIPDSVAAIGAWTFGWCSNLTTIIIPGSVSHIEEYTFHSCTGLTSVTFEDGVTSIGPGVFQDCFGLTSVTIPDSVTVIGDNAFGDCSGLIEVTIPGSVENIGEYAFGSCSSLTSVTIEHGVTSIGDSAFAHCCSLTAITLPDSVTYIGPWAFFNCCSLTELTVPGSVDSIRDQAFGCCSSLISVTIESGVTSIESNAFGSCESLRSLTVGDGVTGIGGDAFYGCYNLTWLVIADSVTNIGAYAFPDSYNLTHIYYTGTQMQWDSLEIEEGNDPLFYAEVHCQFDIHHDHIYTDWYVSEYPTFTEDGQQLQHCTVCGHTVSETVPPAVTNVSHWNIALEDDFRLNFHLQISPSIEAIALVKLVVGDSVQTCPVSELEQIEDGVYLLSAHLSAAQMNENVIVVVTSGREIGCNAIYSVRQYCDTILADENYSQYHAIVREMLNYGAMAQLYFDYDVENLVNSDIGDVANAEVPESTEDIAVDDGIEGLNFYGASLLFRDRIAVRYYFTGDVSDCTFTSGDTVYEPMDKVGVYYVEIADILPQDLDQQFTLTVTDSAENTLSVTYGPMNYIVRMNEKGSEALQSLVKALYNYHLAVKEFSVNA